MNLSALLERSPDARPRYLAGPRPDAAGRFRRRCLRHPGTDLLETDQLAPMSTETGLTCPVDGAAIEVWIVVDVVTGRRWWTADGQSGAHLPGREWLP